MKEKTVNTALRSRARRAICFLLVFITAFMLLPLGAAAETPSGDGALIKTPKPFRPVEVEQTELPEQRSDLKPGVIDCMSSAKSAVLIEATSGQMLLSSNPSERLPMASTTKTMTALVVIENCSLDEVVTVTKDAIGVGGSCLYMYEGEKLTVRDLLYGLMLRSGNDAAVALAVHVGGSVEGFADMMNERAAKMGLKDTHFVTPNGLHRDDHYTTAYELCMIAAKAMEYEEFRTIVSTQYYSIHTDRRTITVKNKNSMLWNYEDCVGIKTGYTSKAGRCLLFAAERNGMLLIGCVLNCRPMFDVAPEMLDYGFENFSLVKAVSAETELSRGVVRFGEKDMISLAAKDDIFVPVRNGDELNVEADIKLNELIVAPVIAGDELGTCSFSIGGCVVGETALIAREDVAFRGFKTYFYYLMRLFARG